MLFCVAAPPLKNLLYYSLSLMSVYIESIEHKVIAAKQLYFYEPLKPYKMHSLNR